MQIYLNLAGRDPAADGLQQVPADDEAATVAAIEEAFLALTDPNDWTGDGAPEGWPVIDRAFSKAEARAIPNGPDTTADMAHPTRTGDLVVFSSPPYQFDAATPGTLIARSAFFGQHGYVPDVASDDPDANTNMRATFLAGGQLVSQGDIEGMRSIDVAPTAAFLLGVPVPQQSQGRVVLPMLRGSERVPARQRHRAQRLPRATRPDDHPDRRPQRPGRRRRRAGHHVRRGSRRAPRRDAAARRR